MKVSCPVCGAADNQVIAPYRGTTPIFRNMQVLECDMCQMVFGGPIPSEEELERYNAGYFENAHGGRSTNKISIAFFYGIARLRYGYVKKYIQKHGITINNVLEIGPGHGYFAENWLLHHPNTTYFAIESDESCYESLKNTGVKIIQNTDPVNEVDLVVMSHVLEHITPPIPFIQNFTSKLKKGGVLFIEVPCQDWKHKSHVEPHLLFFDKNSMTDLLTRTGFENIEVSYYGKKIKELQHPSFLSSYVTKARNLLVRLGIFWPLAAKQKGMEELKDPVERVAVAPYNAHIESTEPAWWLRVTAMKR